MYAYAPGYAPQGYGAPLYDPTSYPNPNMAQRSGTPPPWPEAYGQTIHRAGTQPPPASRRPQPNPVDQPRRRASSDPSFHAYNSYHTGGSQYGVPPVAKPPQNRPIPPAGLNVSMPDPQRARSMSNPGPPPNKPMGIPNITLSKDPRERDVQIRRLRKFADTQGAPEKVQAYHRMIDAVIQAASVGGGGGREVPRPRQNSMPQPPQNVQPMGNSYGSHASSFGSSSHATPYRPAPNSHAPNVATQIPMPPQAKQPSPTRPPHASSSMSRPANVQTQQAPPALHASQNRQYAARPVNTVAPFETIDGMPSLHRQSSLTRPQPHFQPPHPDHILSKQPSFTTQQQQLHRSSQQPPHLHSSHPTPTRPHPQSQQHPSTSGYNFVGPGTPTPKHAPQNTRGAKAPKPALRPANQFQSHVKTATVSFQSPTLGAGEVSPAVTETSIVPVKKPATYSIKHPLASLNSPMLDLSDLDFRNATMPQPIPISGTSHTFSMDDVGRLSRKMTRSSNKIESAAGHAPSGDDSIFAFPESLEQEAPPPLNTPFDLNLPNEFRETMSGYKLDSSEYTRPIMGKLEKMSYSGHAKRRFIKGTGMSMGVFPETDGKKVMFRLDVVDTAGCVTRYWEFCMAVIIRMFAAGELGQTRLRAWMDSTARKRWGEFIYSHMFKLGSDLLKILHLNILAWSSGDWLFRNAPNSYRRDDKQHSEWYKAHTSFVDSVRVVCDEIMTFRLRIEKTLGAVSKFRDFFGSSLETRDGDEFNQIFVFLEAVIRRIEQQRGLWEKQWSREKVVHYTPRLYMYSRTQSGGWTELFQHRRSAFYDFFTQIGRLLNEAHGALLQSTRDVVRYGGLPQQRALTYEAAVQQAKPNKIWKTGRIEDF